jgi:hypothetical protein
MNAWRMVAENEAWGASWPQSAQNNPAKLIRSSQLRPRILPAQDPELLPECKVFQKEIAARTQELGKQARQKAVKANHDASLIQFQAL